MAMPAGYNLLEIAGATTGQAHRYRHWRCQETPRGHRDHQKHFPDLQMLVRSSNRYDAYDLMNAGDAPYLPRNPRYQPPPGCGCHEDAWAIPPTVADRAAKTFFTHDEKALKYLSTIRNDEEYITAARRNMEELIRLVQADRVVAGAQPPTIYWWLLSGTTITADDLSAEMLTVRSDAQRQCVIDKCCTARRRCAGDGHAVRSCRRPQRYRSGRHRPAQRSAAQRRAARRRPGPPAGSNTQYRRLPPSRYLVGRNQCIKQQLSPNCQHLKAHTTPLQI